MLPEIWIFRPLRMTGEDAEVVMADVAVIPLIAALPVTLSPPGALIAPSVMSFVSVMLTTLPLAAIVPKSLVVPFRVMALPGEMKSDVPVTVMPVPETCVIAPEGELTVRFAAEVAPSLVALLLKIVTFVPELTMQPVE